MDLTRAYVELDGKFADCTNNHELSVSTVVELPGRCRGDRRVPPSSVQYLIYAGYKVIRRLRSGTHASVTLYVPDMITSTPTMSRSATAAQ